LINKPIGYTVAVDVAYSDDQPMDYELMKNAGVDMLIFKAGQLGKDPLADKHAQGALDAGMILASYWYLQIDGDPGYQSEIFKSVTDKYNFRFIAPDIEQQKGYSYKKVKNKLRKKYGIYPSNQINDKAWAITKYIEKWKKCELLQYTRTSYIYEFSPQLDDWIINYSLWLAQYPFTINKNGDWGEWIYTWNKELADKKRFTYCPTWEEYFELYAPKPDRIIDLPNGAKDWKIWQFTGDRVCLPGTGSYIDINWVRTDWLYNIEIPEQPIPEESTEILYKMKFTATTLTVRNSPMFSGEFKRYLSHGDVVDIYEVFSNGWVKIGDGEYVNGKYLEKIN